jgi:hypothetical protein
MTLSISCPYYAATIGLAAAQNAASPAAGVHQLHDRRGPWSGLPRGLSSPGALAVFAVFTGNYQRATWPSPQKSWSSGSPASKEQRARPL